MQPNRFVTKPAVQTPSTRPNQPGTGMQRSFQQHQPQGQVQKPQAQQPVQQYNQPAQGQRPTSGPVLRPAQPQGQAQVPHQAPPQQQAQHVVQVPQNIRTIASLNPYHTKSWVVLARVSFKSPIKTWSNDRGEGKLFSVDLMDGSGEIRCTMFNDAVDAFFNVFEQGKAYYISKGQIKQVRNKKFSTLPNDFEMTLSNGSEVFECQDESQVALPLTNYHPVKLASLNEIEPETTIDAIVILSHVGDVQEITSKKDQRQLLKRSLNILDDTATTELTLWGDEAQNWSIPANVCLAVKNVRVTEFSGRSLTASKNSRYEHEEVINLSNWYGNQTEESIAALPALKKPFSGDAGMISANTPSMSLEEGKAECQRVGAPVFFKIRGTIVMMKHDENQALYYLACPAENCSKKVSQRDDGTWFCERCNQAYPVMQPRYILSLVISDYSGKSWCNAFNDAGKLLLGLEAAEIKQAREMNDPMFEVAFRTACYQELSLKMKAVEEVYNDEPRVKCTVMAVGIVNYVEESVDLLNKINQYRGLA